MGYLGFYQEGLELCKKAVDLDPLQAWSYQSLTHAFAVNGLFGDALIAWRRENEISKRDGSSTQTHLLVLNGQVKEALDLVNKINEEQERLFLLTLIYHINNQRVKSDEYFQMFKDKFGSINPLSVNEILVFCGKKEEALSKLHNAFLVKKIRWPSADEQFRFAPYLKGSPYLIPIRNEPRFKDFARKWNYPE